MNDPKRRVFVFTLNLLRIALLNPFLHNVEKYYRKIFKVCSAILQHYT